MALQVISEDAGCFSLLCQVRIRPDPGPAEVQEWSQKPNCLRIDLGAKASGFSGRRKACDSQFHSLFEKLSCVFLVKSRCP